MALPLAVCGSPPTRTCGIFSPVLTHQPIIPYRGVSATYVLGGIYHCARKRVKKKLDTLGYLLVTKAAISNPLKTFLIGFSTVF